MTLRFHFQWGLFLSLARVVSTSPKVWDTTTSRPTERRRKKRPDIRKLWRESSFFFFWDVFDEERSKFSNPMFIHRSTLIIQVCMLFVHEYFYLAQHQVYLRVFFITSSRTNLFSCICYPFGMISHVKAKNKCYFVIFFKTPSGYFGYFLFFLNFSFRIFLI